MKNFIQLYFYNIFAEQFIRLDCDQFGNFLIHTRVR